MARQPITCAQLYSAVRIPFLGPHIGPPPSEVTVYGSFDSPIDGGGNGIFGGRDLADELLVDLGGGGTSIDQPSVDVGGVRKNIAEWLNNPGCSAYISNLINEAARQNKGNPPVSANLLDIFDLVKAQGGFRRLQVGTHQNPSYSHVTGSIPKRDATVFLAPLKLYPDMSAGEIARGALSLDSLGAFHELTHLAGSKQYDDRQLSRAAQRLGGPALPTDKNNNNLAFSHYLDDELRRNCGIR